MAAPAQTTENSTDPYADYFAARDRHTALLMQRGPRPGHALAVTLVDGRPTRPIEAPLGSVRAHVRHARTKHTVHEYDITARDSTRLRIVAIRHAPGTWTNADDVVDVYEIPHEGLTAL
jgi:hypothetical protein